MNNPWVDIKNPKNLFNLDSLEGQSIENAFAHGYNFCLFDKQLATGKSFLCTEWAALGKVCLDWAIKKGRTIRDIEELPHACMRFFVEGLN